MTEFLQRTVDKFTFRIASDRWYTLQGLWVMPEASGVVRVGVSDYLQQRSGDVAFVDVRQPGSSLSGGDELANIETIKVTESLTVPFVATVVETNPALDFTPEIVNQDPYGQGWLALLSIKDWESARHSLLSSQAYFEQVQVAAREAL